MQPAVFDYYRDLIFPRFPPPGKRILEIGALGSRSQDLLGIFASQQADYEMIGINLSIPANLPDGLGYKLLRCSSNNMDIFPDNSFDAVICHGVFNNDMYFWRSISEIRRVLRPEGLFYTGVPGFEGGERKLKIKRELYRFGEKYKPLERLFISLAENTWLSVVPTYHYSPTPKDYYRFSESTVKEVIMEGFDILHHESLLYPPRLIAVGRKKS
jgi:SAM-dependent methyltransferase